MIVFLLKKTFFDLWDNALRLALLNIGFIVSLAFFSLIYKLLEVFSPLPGIVTGLLFFSGAVWHSVYLAAASSCVKNISDYKTFGFSDFGNGLRSAWSGGILYGIFVCIAVSLCIFVIPFYLLLNSSSGLFIASLLFWVLVILVAALQYFFAVRARLAAKKDTPQDSGSTQDMAGRIPDTQSSGKLMRKLSIRDSSNIKSIRKCFLLFLDNPLFFAGTMFLTFLFFIVSVFFAFILPGPAGVLLFLDEALRLRLLKYDWIEQNSGVDRKYIPWDTVLAEEREKTGSRSIRALIFPWKD